MGNVCGQPDPMAATTKAIEDNIKKDKEWLQDEIKLLLLGTGESGKSTVFKQFKILQVDGEELASYKRIILSNTINQMKILISAGLRLGIELDSEDHRAAAQRVGLLDGYASWSPEVGAMIGQLWQDRGIRQTYEQRSQFFQLDDSAGYLFENVGRFSDPNYEPSTQDVLRARSRTTGIDEAEFHFNDIDFRLIDVGVIFCISMSEYDQYLREDPSQNRTRESLLLFDEIVNSQWFSKIPFIIFFNKIDLFNEKVKQVPLRSCFPDYTGGNDPETAKQYMASKFMELNTIPEHRMFHHFTCAIDPTQMQTIFGAVRKTMIEQIIKDSFH